MARAVGKLGLLVTDLLHAVSKCALPTSTVFPLALSSSLVSMMNARNQDSRFRCLASLSYLTQPETAATTAHGFKGVGARYCQEAAVSLLSLPRMHALHNHRDNKRISKRCYQQQQLRLPLVPDTTPAATTIRFQQISREGGPTDNSG